MQEVTSALPYSFQVAAIMPKKEEIGDDWEKVLRIAKQNYSADVTPEFDVRSA